jgi:hypothetical protein
MDELNLSYFVEVQDEISGTITISKDRRVLELRSLIHEAISATSNSKAAWELTLLKVCHKTSLFFLARTDFLTHLG